jgi:hypothetical protein
MDWITFASKAIDALAWPIVALLLGLVFRRKVLDLIPNIRKFRAGPLEAEFELAAKDLLANANQAAAHSKSAAPVRSDEVSSERRTNIIEKLLDARNDPAGMILGGWASVDGELFRLGLQLEILGDPLASTAKVYDAVMATEILPSDTGRLVRELRDLRNQVVHAKVAPTVDAAQDYLLAVDRVVELIHNYRKNLPKYGPSNR